MYTVKFCYIQILKVFLEIIGDRVSEDVLYTEEHCVRRDKSASNSPDIQLPTVREDQLQDNRGWYPCSSESAKPQTMISKYACMNTRKL